jgi:hypothetical protein
MSRKWLIDPDGNVDDEAMAFINELKGLILSRHPEATFAISPGPDNPTAIRLHAYVDLDDPFEIADEIRDRIVDIQVDHEIPLDVAPHRTPERELAHRARKAAGRLSGA